MAATTESFSPMTDSLFLTALVLASMYGYHALWTKVTSLSLFAPQVKPSEASRGRIWCFAWSAAFFLLSSYWPVAKLLGIKTPGEGEYEDFLVTVLGGGKSLLAHLGNNVLVLRSIYLAVMPSCLEGSLAQGKASPKTVSLLYFLLPLSHAWPLAHQCAMSLLGGGSKINGQWLQDGFLVRDAFTPELDFLYWCSSALYIVVYAAVALVSIQGGSVLGPFFGCGGGKPKQEQRELSARFLRFWLNAAALVLGGWVLINNHGVPDPTSPGEHLLEPLEGGNPKLYSKTYDQYQIWICYILLGAALFRHLRDDGETTHATWWTKIDALNCLAVPTFFYGTAFYIIHTKQGHILHPSWREHGSPKAATWLWDRMAMLSTVNFTVVNTNLHVLTVIGHLPKVLYKPFETCAKNVRTNLVFHGLLVLCWSGFWCYAACCGLTVPFEFLGLKQALSHPPIHHCSVKYTVLTHVSHVLSGVIMASFGHVVCELELYLKENFSAGLNLQPFSSFWTKALYASTLFSVTCVHMQVIPACHEPVAEGMDLTLYKAASAASLATLALFRFAGGAFFLNYIIKASKFYGTQHAKGE